MKLVIFCCFKNNFISHSSGLSMRFLRPERRKIVIEFAIAFFQLHKPIGKSYYFFEFKDQFEVGWASNGRIISCFEKAMA